MDQAAKLRAIASKKREGRKAKGPRLIAVSSGKGGVGKTHLAVNLSLHLLQKGHRVGLMDADLGMANVDVALGINPRYNLSHVFFHQLSLDEIVIEGPLGLKLIAGASGSADLAGLTEEAILSFIHDWRNFTYNLDFLIIDTSPGISRTVTSFVLSCDETIIVCTPDPLSITDAYSMVKVLSRDLNQTLHLVINRSRDLKSSRSISSRMLKTVKKYLNIDMKLLGIIPEDDQVFKALNRQRPLLLEYPSSKASIAMKGIAKGIMDTMGEAKEASEAGFIYRLLGLFRQ